MVVDDHPVSDLFNSLPTSDECPLEFQVPSEQSQSLSEYSHRGFRIAVYKRGVKGEVIKYKTYKRCFDVFLFGHYD